jgi:hypothetical protein
MITLKNDIVIAIYDWHSAVERAVIALQDGGCNMKRISMVIRNGAFWGRLRQLLLDSTPVFIPVHGATLALGSFAAARIRSAQDMIVLGDSTALGDVLSLLGMSMQSASRCETALRANDFILVTHGDERDVYRMRELLETSGFVTMERLQVREEISHAA